MHSDRRDVKSGALLVAVALAGVVVMAFHPTAHGLMDPATAQRTALVNVAVHSLAIASAPLLFLAMLGVARYLGPSDLTAAGLVAVGFAAVGTLGAATASGFVAPGVIRSIVAAEGSRMPDAFLLYTGLWNQGFAKVHTVASGVGIVLWSAAILRTRRMPRPIAWYGVLAGAAIAALVLAGVITLNVHGFGLVTIAQSIWFVAVGWAMTRRD